MKELQVRKEEQKKLRISLTSVLVRLMWSPLSKGN
jgi:hypothetical protein